MLYLNLNTNRYGEAKKLEGVLENHFKRWEAKYAIDFIADDYAQRLENIIIGAHEKTGRKAVILVDEMDTRKTYLIGVAFSSKTRCIEDWEIDPMPHSAS